MQKAGCILGGGLRGPKARLLLMLALAKEGNTPALKKYFREP